MAQKILIIGGTGLIGSHVVQELRDDYEVLPVSRSTETPVDMEDRGSLQGLFAATSYDHVIVAAGAASFGPLVQLDEMKLYVGVKSKMMGQINAALLALENLPAGGSVTLTSGVLAENPMPQTAGGGSIPGTLPLGVSPNRQRS